MDKYFTIMIIPERDKGVRSIRIPRVFFHSFIFFSIVLVFLLGILTYDYWKILSEVYKNKHLTIENRQLKEQIQLFQMKINGLSEDLERIHVFEKKLRIITGLDEAVDMSKAVRGSDDQRPQLNNFSEPDSGLSSPNNPEGNIQQKPIFRNLDSLKNFENTQDYNNLKNLYEQKIATRFGLQTSYNYTKEWSELTKQSFVLADHYATFDYKYNIVEDFAKNLEVDIHRLDQELLDKESILKSTPTLLPTKGWITSYYGPRISPTSGRLRMHEGIDIGANRGTPIMAAADGRIVFAGVKPGFGKFVQIDHGYGIESFYAHNKQLFVKKGEIINRGIKIAAVGNSGASTGPHLHYEIRVNGTPVDPLYFILDR